MKKVRLTINKLYRWVDGLLSGEASGHEPVVWGAQPMLVSSPDTIYVCCISGCEVISQDHVTCVHPYQRHCAV